MAEQCARMKLALKHRWDLSPAEARALQESLRQQVLLRPPAAAPRLVAGVDVSVAGRRWKEATSHAAVVVLDYHTLDPVDLATATRPAPFPYVPGLLSFREIPVLLAALEQLRQWPDLVLVDGQGYAHPRRLGLAVHLGLVLDLPTVGCAKTRLIGDHDEPDTPAGSYTDLIDTSVTPPEIIGAVLRTRTDVAPLFISAGHRMDTPTAIDHVLQLTAGYRLPEPTRLAHQASQGRTLAELQQRHHRRR